MENLTKEELLKLKSDKEAEIREIEIALEHVEKLEKPFRYYVSSYGKCPNSGTKKAVQANKKLVEYANKERIGTSLIYYGYTSEYKADKTNEILSIMFLKQHSSMNAVFNNFEFILKNQHEYKERVTLSELLHYWGLKLLDYLNFAEGAKNSVKLLQDLQKLGDTLENIEEDNLELLKKGIELDFYKVYSAGNKYVLEMM